MDSVTVVIPTLGRPTLAAAVASVPAAWRTLVVADGLTAYQAAKEHTNGATLTCTEATNVLGHAQRNFGMAQAQSRWLMFLDDDDAQVPDVYELVTAHVKTRRPHIFQMRYPEGTVFWPNPELKRGTVGTPMFVVPNEPGKLGRWPSRECGDFDFIEETCRLQGDPVFVPQVIALVRPQDGSN